MLVAVALAIGQNPRQRAAAFAVCFGVWDIFYYVFLRLLLDWPESLVTWDLLFLLPLPWVGPVWSPVLVSLALVVAGIVTLWRESLGVPVRFALQHVAAIGAAVLAVIVAFCWDWRNIIAGGTPNHFNWPILILGLVGGMAAFAHSVWRRRGDPETCGREESASYPTPTAQPPEPGRTHEMPAIEVPAPDQVAATPSPGARYKLEQIIHPGSTGLRLFDV
jgi:hypothetical protein